MKIGIDCRMSGLSHAGIGRYIENLICELPNIGKDIEWVFFFRSESQVRDSKTLNESWQKKPNITCVYVDVPHYTLEEQTKLPEVFAKYNLDLLHIPHFNAPVFYGGKTVVTIHDLLWHQYQGLAVTTLNPWLYWFKYMAYRFVTSRAVSKASKILVPAVAVKNQLLNYYPDVKNKINITKEGVASAFTKPAKSNKKFNDHLVYVGSLYPHKNIELVLKALQANQDLQLTIVGSRNVFSNQTKKMTEVYKVVNRVEFAGRLSDQELLDLYKQGVALVQPSLSEGFGLTGVEAMSSGVPVIASDIPVFKEIYQDAASYFNPKDVDEFLLAVEKTKKNQSQLIKAGLKVTKPYRWQNTAKQTLEAYLDVV